MSQVQEGKSFLQQWQICLKKSVECPEKVRVLLLISHIQVLLSTSRSDRLELLAYELSIDLALKDHQLSKYYYNPNNYDPNDDEY
jgi:hypothetical protein